MTCIVSSQYVSIKHIENKKDVWQDEEDSRPTEVGLRNGKMEYRPELRESVSIRDKFQVTWPPLLMENYFDKLYIGIGSKHIYHPGNFMKEHYDTRLPDYKGLPHIMTLIVTDNIADLRIDGKKIECERFQNRYLVLFSLNLPHEVVPVAWKRISFVFPVYGIYNPSRVLRDISRKKFTDVYDNAISALDDEKMEMEKKQAHIEAIDDSKTFSLFLTLRRLSGDYVCMNKWDYADDIDPTAFTAETHLCYRKDGVQFEKTLNGNDPLTKLSGCEEITVKLVTPRDVLLRKIKESILEAKRFTEEEYQNVTAQQHSKFPDIMTLSIPSEPFIIALEGKYFFDSKETDMIERDMAVYNYIKTSGKEVKFIPLTTVSKKTIPIYRISEEKLEEISGEEINTFGRVDSVYAEFDDQGSYDPIYQLTYGSLLVI